MDSNDFPPHALRKRTVPSSLWGHEFHEARKESGYTLKAGRVWEQDKAWYFSLATPARTHGPFKSRGEACKGLEEMLRRSH
jgi:hypothetical protein